MSAPLPASPAKHDHRETQELYARVLVRNGRYRVAVCEDGIQWLLQRQRGHFPPGGAAWDTIAYCRTRRAIVRLYRALIGMDAPELAELPAFLNDSANYPVADVLRTTSRNPKR